MLYARAASIEMVSCIRQMTWSLGQSNIEYTLSIQEFLLLLWLSMLIVAASSSMLLGLAINHYEKKIDVSTF